MASLNVEANEKGYTIVKAFPTSLLITNRFTGKVVSRHKDLFEVRDALKELPSVVPLKVPSVPVGWQDAPPPGSIAAAPRVCPNGGGPMCLCVSPTEWYFCAIRTCHQRAQCGGACPDHYTQTKIIGDLTEVALLHTQSHEDDGDLEEIKSRPAKKVSLKWDSRRPTDGTPEPTVPLPVGWNTRPSGDHWIVVDTLGNPVSQGATAQEAANNLYRID